MRHDKRADPDDGPGHVPCNRGVAMNWTSPQLSVGLGEALGVDVNNAPPPKIIHARTSLAVRNLLAAPSR